MPKQPSPVDHYVGSRVRMRRLMLNMSQEKLAHQLRLTFQQVQKYEKGKNRISASRLQELSRILQVPVPFFFEGAPQGGGARESAQSAMISELTEFLGTADSLALMRAFARVKSPKVRRSVVHLIERIAAYGA